MCSDTFQHGTSGRPTVESRCTIFCSFARLGTAPGLSDSCCAVPSYNAQQLACVTSGATRALQRGLGPLRQFGKLGAGVLAYEWVFSPLSGSASAGTARLFGGSFSR